MRIQFLALAAALALPTAPTLAAPQRATQFQSLAEVTDFINGYRYSRDAGRAGEAIRAASDFGALKDPEQAGVYVGFIAGVIGASGNGADRVIADLFPLNESEHWAVVRGIAYSGAPNWKFLLRRAAHRMPSRQVMIESYLQGRLPVLGDLRIAPSPTTWQRVKNSLALGKAGPKQPEMEPSQTLLDTLWGYYLASGSYGPLMRIVDLLPWSLDRDDVEKLTVGSMAKYTLAANASRDTHLRDALRTLRGVKAKHDTAASLKPLDEVIAAAETAETGKLRKDALAAIEQVKMKGPAYKRELSTWGKIGQGAIAVGCVAAAATGQVQFGLPCVIGGGATNAAAYYLNDR